MTGTEPPGPRLMSTDAWWAQATRPEREGVERDSKMVGDMPDVPDQSPPPSLLAWYLPARQRRIRALLRQRAWAV